MPYYQIPIDNIIKQSQIIKACGYENASMKAVSSLLSVILPSCRSAYNVGKIAHEGKMEVK